MKLAKIISLLGILAMTAALTYAFTVGNLADEGSQLTSMPWGIVSLVDLYTGFILFSMWIFYREEDLPTRIAWSIAVMVLGFFTGALYTFLALHSSNGDWRKFWLGRHA